MTTTGQIGVDRHPLAARKDDFYPTNPAAVRALLAVEKLPHRLWEPFAGNFKPDVPINNPAKYVILCSGCLSAALERWAPGRSRRII